MLALHKSLLPSSSNFYFAASGVNGRSPSPFQCLGFGSHQQTPLSPVRPRQGGLQSSASSVCWAKKKKAKEPPTTQQKATGFGKKATKAEGPSIQQKSKTDDAMEFLEKLTLSDGFTEWIDLSIYNHMPPACDVAWVETQQAWLDLAINHPIMLNNGECAFHVLGVSHLVPTNASAVRALVKAVKPDTIAIEQAPQESKRLRAVAQELAPQLDKLMALEFPVGIREAHMALSPQDRCRWRQVIFKGELALKPGECPEFEREKGDLMLFGNVPLIEWLAAALLAPSGNGGISLEGIDLEVRTKSKRVLADPGFSQEFNRQLQQLQGPSASWHKLGADPAFDEWQKTAATVELLMNMNPMNDSRLPMPPGWDQFLEVLGFVSMSPTDEKGSRIGRVPEEIVSRMTGKAATYAQTLGDNRDLEMLDRLQLLAEGRWSAGALPRPRKVIVAVVGQAHVAPMRQLAEMAARKKMLIM